MEPFYECVHHLDNQHLRTYYDYVDILQNDTKAKIARLLEWVTNEAGTQWARAMHFAVSHGKEMEPEPEFWVWLSHKWFLDQIVPHIHEDTLRKHLNEMERDEWIAVRPHPDPRKRHLAPQYLFNSLKMQEAFEAREKRKKAAIRKDGRRALSPYLEGIPQYDESKEYSRLGGTQSPTPSENIEGVGKGRGGRHRPGGSKTSTPSENIEGVGKGVPPGKTPTRGVGNDRPGRYENTDQGGW